MKAKGKFSADIPLTHPNVVQVIFRGLEVVGASAAALIIIERFNQEGTGLLWLWFLNSPKIVIANVLILASIYGLIRICFRKPLIPACIYGGLIFGIGCVHYYKVLLKGEPLMPIDVLNVKTAAMIAPNMNIQLNRGFWINLGFLLFCILLIALYQQFILRPLPVRRWFYIVPIACLAALCLIGFSNSKIRNQFDVVDIRYDQSYNYKYNGFMMAALMNTGGTRVKAPEGYDQAYFQQLLQSRDLDAVPAVKSESLPTIIVVQTEAFSDPRLLDNTLKYDPDPFAALEKYRGSMHSFKTLTSVLGGSTATTEFEFLTGFNMAYAPQGIMPFVQYMSKERPSLAWDLQKMGYETIGIHANVGTFYARDKAYPRLGFQKFFTIDDFKEPQYQGYYVSDQSTEEKIIETYENKPHNQPLFCFTVTIQNHGPYNLTGIDRKYGVQEGAVALTETQNRELRNFGANLQDESQMLANLIQYFSEQNEPVLLLAYGDHQATWSWSKSLPDSQNLQAAKYLTEGFFWTNYPVDFEKRTVIGANYLSPYLFKYAGLPLPAYYQLLYQEATQVLGYNPFFVLKNDHSIVMQPDSEIESFALLQYDRTFGKDYLGLLLQNKNNQLQKAEK